MTLHPEIVGRTLELERAGFLARVGLSHCAEERAPRVPHARRVLVVGGRLLDASFEVEDAGPVAGKFLGLRDEADAVHPVVR